MRPQAAAVLVLSVLTGATWAVLVEPVLRHPSQARQLSVLAVVAAAREKMAEGSLAPLEARAAPVVAVPVRAASTTVSAERRGPAAVVVAPRRGRTLATRRSAAQAAAA
jgi:hypothetical protein